MVPNKELINQLYSVVGEIVELLNSCFGYKLTIGRSVNEVCMDMGCMYYTIYIIYIYILYSTQYTLHTNHTPPPMQQYINHIDTYNHHSVCNNGTIPHITLCSPAMLSPLYDVKLLDMYLTQAGEGNGNSSNNSNNSSNRGSNGSNKDNRVRDSNMEVNLVNPMQAVIFDSGITHMVLDEVCMGDSVYVYVVYGGLCVCVWCIGVVCMGVVCTIYIVLCLYVLYNI